MGLRMTEEQLSLLLQKGNVRTSDVPGVRRKPVAPVPPDVTEISPAPKPKKRNVALEAIESVRNSDVSVVRNENGISVCFDGARLLTYNQIISLLDSQKFNFFKYKKAWAEKVQMALLDAGVGRLEPIGRKKPDGFVPLLPGPVVIHKYRRSPRLTDMDADDSSFKLLVDLLVRNGIVWDDSRDIVVPGGVSVAVAGDYRVAVSVERVTHPEPVSEDAIRQMFPSLPTT